MDREKMSRHEQIRVEHVCPYRVDRCPADLGDLLSSVIAACDNL